MEFYCRTMARAVKCEVRYGVAVLCFLPVQEISRKKKWEIQDKFVCQRQMP